MILTAYIHNFGSRSEKGEFVPLTPWHAKGFRVKIKWCVTIPVSNAFD